MFKNSCFLFCGFILSYALCMSQNVISMDTMGNMNNNNKLNITSSKLIQSISDNKNKVEIAENYYLLSKELSVIGDYIKAEQYMEKAIQIEKGNKKSDKLGEYYRELAKIQEMLKKNELSSENYKNAAEFSIDKVLKQINFNDAKRVKHKSSPEVDINYRSMNVELFNATDNNAEKIENLTQMAYSNQSLNQNNQAFENYRQALTVADSTSESSIKIKNNMAILMAETNNFDEAINIQKEVVEQSQKIASVETQVRQMQNLSTLYLKTNSLAEGLSILQDAYMLAVEHGNINEAKSSLLSLVEYYERNKENTKVLNLYKDFVEHLETLISNDSSLIDKSIFLINEGKISLLEKEQTLKDELIDRKNRYNYVLFGSVLLLLILLLLIIKAWHSIKKRNKRIALQSLRREMNPHFIFNSLNSMNQFIAENNELEANKYLTSYSTLMRNMMENSNKDHITLNNEIDHLTKYLELEQLRFADKFEYTIEIDESIDKDSEMIPNMILQPNIENSIWHGLRYKQTKGLLEIKFSKVGERMKVSIEDDGIGLEESRKIKTQNQKIHESRGLKNVHERIRLLNELYKADIHFEIKEKTGIESGVIVNIEW